MQYEYKTIDSYDTQAYKQVWAGDGNPDSKINLNELGKEGWQLVGILPLTYTTRFYFMRFIMTISTPAAPPPKIKTNPYEYACKEWLRGCSCSIDFKTLKNNPKTCVECTENFYKYIKNLEHNEKHYKE